jgi:hypothetical protein
MTIPAGWAQFEAIDTLDGAQVIDVRTGHPVAERETRQSAAGYAHWLNQAAADGPEALVGALGGGTRKRTTTKVTQASGFKP